MQTMICRVKYFDERVGAYGGAEYTYLSDIPLRVLQKVMVPVGNENELKKAIVTTVDLPTSVISPAWADRLKKIKGEDQV